MSACIPRRRLRRSSRRGSSAATLASALLLLSITTAAAQPPPQGPCGLSGTRCCEEDDDNPEGDGPPLPCRFFGSQICSPSNLCTSCGRAGEPCCPDDECRDNPAPSTCNAAGICEVTCGLAGLPCCPAGDVIDGSADADGCSERLSPTACVDDVCRRCGQVGQPCCEDPDFTCSNQGRQGQCDAATNTCFPATCGLIGQICCEPGERQGLLDPPEGEDGLCEYNAFCDGGECAACGYDGQPCCLNGARNDECRPEYGPEYVYDGSCSSENVCSGGEAPGPLPAPPPGPPVPPGPPEGCGVPGVRCCGPEDGADAVECRDVISSLSDINVCTDGLCTLCGDSGLPCCPGVPVADACAGDDLSFCNADGICSGDCGFVGGRCCAGDRCSTGNRCAAETGTCVEITCGLFGQPCCTAADAPAAPCIDVLACDPGGTCSVCGLNGGTCCPNPNPQVGLTGCRGETAECLPDNTCTDALPEDGFCGYYGDYCCPGDICARGSRCDTAAGQCEVCGREGTPCCPGDRCDGRAACVDGTCGPPACGSVGAPCCDPAETYELLECVTEDPSVCTGGTCALCGDDGQPCCAEDDEGSVCASPLDCVADVCTDGPVPEPPVPPPPPPPAPPPAATPSPPQPAMPPPPPINPGPGPTGGKRSRRSRRPSTRMRRTRSRGYQKQ